MRSRPPFHRLALAIAVLGAAALAGSSILLARAEAQAAPPRAAHLTCDALITYVPKSGTTETYQRTFHLAPGLTFVDDFSTTTRQHIFSAVATRKGGVVEVEFNYFSDVSTLNNIDLTGTLSIDDRQRFESTSGRQVFSTSNPGSYSLTYTLSCRR